MNLNFSHKIEKAHSGYISSLCFNPCDPTLLASSSNDRTVKLWRISESSREVNQDFEYKVHLYGINQAKWNQEGNMLATAGNDCSVNIMDINKQKINRNFRLDSVITCLNFNSTSNLILLATFDNQIMLYDMRSKNLISQILSHSEPITSVCFSHDSTVMASSSYDGFCRIWDTFKGSCLKTIVLEKSPPINTVCFLPDMNYLLISSLNNQIQIINLLDEEEMIKYSGHANSGHLVDLCFISDQSMDIENTYLVSGSEDGRFYYWDVQESEGKSVKLEGVIDDDNEIGKENAIVNSISTNNNGIIACSAYPKGDNSILLYNYDFNKNINEN